MLSKRSWPITGACWWWSISLPPSGALAVAVAQDMGITVGSLRSDPVSRAYYQPKRNQDKPPWARPFSPWPTAAS